MDQKKCTSRLLSGNGSDALVIFKNMLITCCIGIEIVGHFFQRQRCVVGKKKLFVNLRFFAVWLRDGIYMCRGKSIGTMTTQKPNVVQCKGLFLLAVVCYLFGQMSSSKEMHVVCFLFIL